MRGALQRGAGRPGGRRGLPRLLSVQPAGCTIAQSEEEGGEAGGYELSATLAMCVRVFRQEETLAVCDAFSTLQNTVLAKRDVVLDETFVPCEQAVTATTGASCQTPGKNYHRHGHRPAAGGAGRGRQSHAARARHGAPAL